MNHIPTTYTDYLFFDVLPELYQESVSGILIQNKHWRLKIACRFLRAQAPTYLSDLFYSYLPLDDSS